MGTKILKAAAVMIGMMTASVLLMTYINTNEHLVKLFSQQETYTLQEIQKEAEGFQHESNMLDCSNMQISIPDVEGAWQVMFRVDAHEPDEAVEKFVQNLKKFTGITQISKKDIRYVFPDSKNSRKIIPYTEASSEQKQSRSTSLFYEDGVYAATLYQSSYIFEIGNGTVPLEFSGDDSDDSDGMSGYRGLDLGTLERTYFIPEDDVTDVVYPLHNGKISIADAIRFVESQIKSDYAFVGSKLLDYQVYQADVRRLAEGVYYYQFKIKASYKGITLNKDIAVYEELDGVLERGFSDCHQAAMYDTDTLGYLRACCHAYQKIVSQNEVTSMISIKDACDIIENKLEAEKELRVDSVELVYCTTYEYASRADKELGIVDAVKCVPVYHFTVQNPESDEQHIMYFDVDVQTGITMESYE